MDLGATVCLPRKPSCLLCPVQPTLRGARARARPSAIRSRRASSSAARSRCGCCRRATRDGRGVAGEAAGARRLGGPLLPAGVRQPRCACCRPCRRACARACATAGRSCMCSRTRTCICIRCRSMCRARRRCRARARGSRRRSGRRWDCRRRCASCWRAALSCRRAQAPSSSRCRLSAAQRAPKPRASCSTRNTERCWPPVQPIATVT